MDTSPKAALDAGRRNAEQLANARAAYRILAARAHQRRRHPSPVNRLDDDLDDTMAVELAVTALRPTPAP